MRIDPGINIEKDASGQGKNILKCQYDNDIMYLRSEVKMPQFKTRKNTIYQSLNFVSGSHTGSPEQSEQRGFYEAGNIIF